MFRAVRLVSAGVCTAICVLSASQAFAQADLKTWYFAEGSTAPFLPFEQEILIGNPTGSEVTVELRFFPQDGGPVNEGALVVKPYSRQGINARQFVGSNVGFSLEVKTSADVVVERSMYWGGGLFNFPGYNTGAITDMRAGTNSVGVNGLRTSWSFAEGSAGFFDTYVLVSNPGAAPATIAVNYYTSQGEQVTVNEVVPAGQRRTYFANDALRTALGARPQFDFATEVTSDVGIVAERAMYWNGFQGGHSTMGVTPQAAWLFAEGAQFDNALSTYVLLFNPNAEAITVETNFYGANGLLQPVLQTIPARSRAQIFAGEYDTLRNQSFSIASTSVGNVPFVAERAVYKTTGGALGEGTVTAGVTTAALKWGFAEGQEGGFAQYQNPADPDRRLFTTYYLVLNNTDTTAFVRGIFYLETPGAEPGGQGVEFTLEVNPRSRGTFAPQVLPGLGNRKFAAFFESNVPVVMERAMYWGNGIRGAHASTGTALPDSLPTLVAPTAPPAPALTGISPSRGTPAGGTIVTLTGTGLGLGNNTTIAFGSTPVPPQNITVNNADSISVVAPASGRGVAGIIVNTRGMELFNPAVTFEYVDPFAAGPAVGYGDLLGVVASVANARRFDLIFSCTEHGSPNSNTFMFEVVAELRRRFQTNRWGLNWKRGNVGDLSQDIVNYYSGPEGSQMLNSTQVRIYDIIGGHCGGNPSPFWVDQTAATRQKGDIGRWAIDPMCRSARYRDAKFDNGQWMFPECR